MDRQVRFRELKIHCNKIRLRKFIKKIIVSKVTLNIVKCNKNHSTN